MTLKSNKISAVLFTILLFASGSLFAQWGPPHESQKVIQPQVTILDTIAVPAPVQKVTPAVSSKPSAKLLTNKPSIKAPVQARPKSGGTPRPVSPTRTVSSRPQITERRPPMPMAARPDIKPRMPQSYNPAARPPPMPFNPAEGRPPMPFNPNNTAIRNPYMDQQVIDATQRRPYYGGDATQRRPYYGGDAVQRRPYYGIDAAQRRPYYGIDAAQRREFNPTPLTRFPPVVASMGQGRTGIVGPSMGQGRTGIVGPSMGQGRTGIVGPSMGQGRTGIVGPAMGQGRTGIVGPAMGQRRSGNPYIPVPDNVSLDDQMGEGVWR